MANLICLLLIISVLKNLFMRCFSAKCLMPQDAINFVVEAFEYLISKPSTSASHLLIVIVFKYLFTAVLWSRLQKISIMLIIVGANV